MPNKPKPTRLRELQGDPHKERYNLKEPQPAKSKDEYPATLRTKAERDVWDRIYPIINDMEIMTVADRESLACLCRIQAMFDKSKDPVQMRLFSRELRQSYAAFGMTPFDRSRIIGQPRKKQESMEDILDGPRIVKDDVRSEAS